MDFKQLEYFVQVAEWGNFTRAAGALRVAQPALSRQVRALEVELRQHLFHRNGRGVTLTDAGQRLLAHGRGILQQVQRAKADLEAQRDEAIGHLSLGLMPSVGRTLTSAMVARFRSRFPKASLSVVEGLSARLLESLAQGRVDLAVVYDPSPSSAWATEPVLREALYLVGLKPSLESTTHTGPRRAGPNKEGPQRPQPPTRLGLAALAQRELVMPSRPNSIRMRVETALAAAGLPAPRIAMEIDSVSAILELVAQEPRWHAVLTRNALRTSGAEAIYSAQAIGRPPLVATLALARSTQRPAGPLLEQASELLRGLLLDNIPVA